MLRPRINLPSSRIRCICATEMWLQIGNSSKRDRSKESGMLCEIPEQSIYIDSKLINKRNDDFPSDKYA